MDILLLTIFYRYNGGYGYVFTPTQRRLTRVRYDFFFFFVVSSSSSVTRWMGINDTSALRPAPRADGSEQSTAAVSHADVPAKP